MMKRTITYRITNEYTGGKISHFLRRKGFSRQCLIELKKMAGSVTVNDIPKRFNERLYAGDVLRVFITEKSCSTVDPVCLPVDIVYEDEDLLVVNKPAGMPTHPSFKNTDNTLANALAWYYREKGESFVFRCSNRLDRDTSGLTIVSRHYVSAAILSEMGTRREISREYLAIAAGHIVPDSGTIDAPLGRKDGSIIERCVDPLHGERAVTHFQVLQRLVYGPSAPDPSPALPLSLVQLNLETGRTHQIRVHMQHIGHPLIGDYLYRGASSESSSAQKQSLDPSAYDGLIDRQALHAHRLRFAHPITGEPLDLSVPLPEYMHAVLSRCRLM